MEDFDNLTARDLAELYLVEVHELFEKSPGIPSYFGTWLQTLSHVLSLSFFGGNHIRAAQFEVELRNNVCADTLDARQRWALINLFFRMQFVQRAMVDAIDVFLRGLGCDSSAIEQSRRSMESAYRVFWTTDDDTLNSFFSLVTSVRPSDVHDPAGIRHELENALLLRDLSRAEDLCRRWKTLSDDGSAECVLAQVKFVAAFEAELTARLPELETLIQKAQSPDHRPELLFAASVYAPIESLLWGVDAWVPTDQVYLMVLAFCCTYQCGSAHGDAALVSEALDSLLLACRSDAARQIVYAPLVATCYERLGRLADSFDSWSAYFWAPDSTRLFGCLVFEKMTDLLQTKAGPRAAEQILSGFVEGMFKVLDKKEAELNEGLIKDSQTRVECLEPYRRELALSLGRLPTRLAQLREGLGDKHGACAALRMQNALDPLFATDLSHRLVLTLSEAMDAEADDTADRAFLRNPDQMNGLLTSVGMHWATLNGLERRAARSWIYGVHLLAFATHEAGFQDETAQHAIAAFTKALELQLRSAIFLPFRSWARTNPERLSRIRDDYASRDGGDLRRFVSEDDARITLGQMMHVARRPRTTDSRVVLDFQGYVQGRDPGLLAILSAARFREMSDERNRAVHEAASSASVTKCRSLCAELLDNLVQLPTVLPTS